LAALNDHVAAALKVSAAGLDAEGTRSLRIVSDHLRAALVIAAAGISPAATRQGYVLRKLIRRAVRHAELLMGSDQNLTSSLVAAADGVSAVMGRRWVDVGSSPEGDVARKTIDQEAGRFAKTLFHGTEELHLLAEGGATFDGEIAFRLADTLGYPAELSAEEASRLGMKVDPGWEGRYEELREEQRARSRR